MQLPVVAQYQLFACSISELSGTHVAQSVLNASSEERAFHGLFWFESTVLKLTLLRFGRAAKMVDHTGEGLHFLLGSLFFSS